MEKLFKSFFKLVRVSVIICLLLFIGLWVIYIVSHSGPPRISERSVLVLRLGGAAPDSANEDPITSRLFPNSSQSMTGFLDQLRKAKSDRRVSGVILQIGSILSGWGKTDELREAILTFRSSGKPVFAFLENVGNKEYYVATSCERIYVAPGSEVLINGLNAEVMFFRGALDKLGVYMDLHHVGKYKNAPDQYTRRNMSDSQREVLNSILDDVFKRYVKAIATARNKPEEDIRRIIDNSPYRASEARDIGLVDGAIYQENVDMEMKKRLGFPNSLNIYKLSDTVYKKVAPESLGMDKGESIGIVYLSGAIDSGKSTDGFGMDQTAGSETIVKALNDAAGDEKIKAIVLRVDSPGGTTVASDLIWNAVDQAKKKKPLVVSMSDSAASGGYYISVGANRIIAQPSTLTGSIGVFAGKAVLQGLYNHLGLSTDDVSRGKVSGMYSQARPFSSYEREKFERRLKSFYYDDFLPRVVAGRKRDLKYIDSIAQGRVWTGAQAKDLGLVDELGGLERAIEVAKDLAKIPSRTSVKRVVFPAARSIIQTILRRDEDESPKKVEISQSAIIGFLPEDMRRTLTYAHLLDRMNRGELVAMMPFYLEIK